MEEMVESLVEQALEELDEDLRECLDNVVVVVEDWPDAETLRLSGVPSPLSLLGFYHGVPQPNRNASYGMVTPDKISIYRQPIVRRCRNLAELRQTVRRVLRHEIAHHFGIDDERLHEIGAY